MNWYESRVTLGEGRKYSERKAAKKFVAAEKEERNVLLHPGYEARKRCAERHLPTDPIRVRLIRVELPISEIEVLASTLLERTRFPTMLLQGLYHHRWPVEEDYSVMKPRVEIENWSGKSPQAVYQEFHAAVFSKNMAAILAHPAQQAVTQHSQQLKNLCHSHAPDRSHVFTMGC